MIFWVALRKELLEQWRSYRLLIVAIVLVLFGMLSPLMARYTPEIIKLALPQGEEILKLMPAPSVVDAVDQYIGNLSQFGILLALLMAMGAVAQEVDKGTAATMLTKPLPRSIFLAAKFVALGLTFAASLVVAAAACYYYTQVLFEPLDWTAWLATNGLLLLSLLVYVAVTLLCSTITRSQVVAAGLAFGVVIVFSLVGAIPRVGDALPGQLTTWGSRIAKGIEGTSWPAVWVGLGLIVGSLLLAWLILERKEI
jgi:ABC-2 type transport system permease protein